MAESRSFHRALAKARTGTGVVGGGSAMASPPTRGHPRGSLASCGCIRVVAATGEWGRGVVKAPACWRLAARPAAWRDAGEVPARWLADVAQLAAGCFSRGRIRRKETRSSDKETASDGEATERKTIPFPAMADEWGPAGGIVQKHAEVPVVGVELRTAYAKLSGGASGLLVLLT